MALAAFLHGHAAWAASFQCRDFKPLWGSTLLQSLGMGMEHVALGWLVLELTDSPFMVGLASAARMAPFFFLGILSGAVADRVDRRAFLRFLAGGAAVIAALMAALLVADVVRVWHVMALAVAMGCVWAFTMTLRQAYTYDVVGPENALNGLALNSLSQRVGGVAGALMAGAIIATLGVGAQYLAVSASYVAGGLVLFAVHGVGRAAATEHQPVLRSVVGYVRLIRENRTLMILMLLAAATEVFGFTHQSLLPVFARDELHVGAIGLGVMSAVRQGGGILGLLLLASLGDFRRKGQLTFAAAVGFGLGLMAFSLATNIFAFVLVLALVNACASAADTLYKTLMQRNVPNEQRGRAMGSWVLSIGTAPAGHIGVGAMAGALGAPAALLINGAILTFIGVTTALGLPKIRRLT